ncbi:uncharacterized protein LOC117177457 isoform X2 [Belonocnema kinseyi]|uniref:uncharacterized protein LOC117177457 isoform X2 n=1 Tax=Belonocnema kinseyi TaxID=2817044 RepID=UPI00143CED34|nr:uncharacterized protein LOC117177457 isoform X2 [Belonocnema kinseyi]
MKMSHIIVIRSYKPGDEVTCREMVKDAVMSSMNAEFLGNLLKEFTFQLMILFAAIMFIFFGLPFTICFTVIPAVIFFMYVGTYAGYATKAMEVDQEISRIPRFYMANAFSCFWVAEAFEPYLMSRHPSQVHYTIMTEDQFRESNIDVSSQAKKIVGTIALAKSRSVEKEIPFRRTSVLTLN